MAAKSKKKEAVNRFLSQSRRIDPEELLLDVVEYFGGPKAFAYAIVKEFNSAPEGGMARQRILEMIHRLTMNVHQSSPPEDDVTDLSENELKAIIEEITPDATATTEADS